MIRSQKKNSWIYTGSTNDLARRMAEHNNGQVQSTRFYLPFKLIYYEAYSSEKDAKTREKNLKLRANALNQLKRRLIYSLDTDHRI
jgi:putative endonuclease